MQIIEEKEYEKARARIALDALTISIAQLGENFRLAGIALVGNIEAASWLIHQIEKEEVRRRVLSWEGIWLWQ